jgi:hypothetical protein
MVVDNPAQESSPSVAAGVRTVRLSAYVDLPLDVVLERFAGPGVDDLLTSAMHAGLALVGEDPIRVHASVPVRQSDANVRVPIVWHDSSRSHDRTATISLLVVQSGREAITELLIELQVLEDRARAATEAAHHVLDELATRIEAAGR